MTYLLSFTSLLSVNFFLSFFYFSSNLSKYKVLFSNINARFKIIKCNKCKACIKDSFVDACQQALEYLNYADSVLQAEVVVG